MYTIVAASQKGGSGKTTLSGHLAVEAARAGTGEIALIDTDPQGSLAAWWNARTAPTPRFVKAGLPDLEEALAGLNRAGVTCRWHSGLVPRSQNVCTSGVAQNRHFGEPALFTPAAATGFS